MTNSSGPTSDSPRGAEDRLVEALYELRLRFLERLCIQLGLKVGRAWLVSEAGLRTDRDILERLVEPSRNLDALGGNWISRWRYWILGRK